MKKYIILALTLVPVLAFAQRPDEVRHYRPSFVSEIEYVQMVAPGQTVYTYYDKDFPLPGIVPDSSWERERDYDYLDTRYRFTLPAVPDDMPQIKIEKGQIDPLRDNTRPAFQENGSANVTHLGQSRGWEVAPDEKEIVAVELFGYTRAVPADVAGQIRFAVADGINKRGRHYVADAQTVLGGDYDQTPVYYGGNLGQFVPTPRMEALYEKGVRYVISGVVAGFFTHYYFSSPTATQPTYETLLTVFITAYDLETCTILQTCWFNGRGTGSRPDLADNSAISAFKSRTAAYVQDNLAIRAEIISLGEVDKKGHYKNCVINVGTEMGSAKTDIYQVFDPEFPGSASIGRIKVTAPGAGQSGCNIMGNKQELQEKLAAGKELILLSDDQSLL